MPINENDLPWIICLMLIVWGYFLEKEAQRCRRNAAKWPVVDATVLRTQSRGSEPAYNIPILSFDFEGKLYEAIPDGFYGVDAGDARPGDTVRIKVNPINPKNCAIYEYERVRKPNWM